MDADLSLFMDDMEFCGDPQLINSTPTCSTNYIVTQASSSTSSINGPGMGVVGGPFPMMPPVRTETQHRPPIVLPPLKTIQEPVQHNEASQSGQESPKVHYCQVCNDTASGFHYGVWSCEGCKAFYKRSLQGPVDYVCPSTNSCMIDKQRRKSCQACRFRKCLEAGMNKGTSRKERSINRQKSGKRKDISPPVADGSVPFPKIKKENDCNIPNALFPAPNPSESGSMIIQHLMNIDMPIIDAEIQEPVNNKDLIKSFLKMSEKHLMNIISWAKQLPDYAKVLPLSDQVHLLERGWLEIALLGLAFQSMPYKDCVLIGRGLYVNREQATLMGEAGLSGFELVIEIIEKMIKLQISREEVVLMKVLALTNSERSGLTNTTEIDNIREKYTKLLMDYTSSHHPNNPMRLPSLLFILTHTRHLSIKSLSFIQSLRIDGKYEVCELVGELLDSQIDVNKMKVERRDIPS